MHITRRGFGAVAAGAGLLIEQRLGARQVGVGGREIRGRARHLRLGGVGRVGRARVSNDFATLRGDILPVLPPAAELGGPAPSLASANGNALPRVQTTEAPGTEVARGPAMLGSDLPAHAEGETPEVASLPGFIIEKPSR